MKRFLAIAVASLCGASAMVAQQPVAVGGGSYAEYTPLYKCRTADHGGDNSRVMETRTLYLSGEAAEAKTIPSNDWWTDLVVSQYSGRLWAYPQVVDAEEYGVYIAYPSYWSSDGCALEHDTKVEVHGLGFNPASATAHRYHDWGLEMELRDGDKAMRVTMAHGVPFTWIEPEELTLQLRCVDAQYLVGGESFSFPATTDRMEAVIDGDRYALYFPQNTYLSLNDDKITIDMTDAGKSYIAVALLPQQATLDDYATYAPIVPRDTRLDWRYDEIKGELVTTYSITTENLEGKSDTDLLQGFIPHHYKNSTLDFSFTPYTYTTPRGTMRMAVGNSFEIVYPFNGILPWQAAPVADASLPNPYDVERMRKLISEYATQGSFGGDTYWGGKGLVQMAMYMTFAYEMGETSLFEQCRTRLREVLENWLTYTPGENSYFFARFPRWGALVGYDTSYDSETFNDHHFHYGYFVHAGALLCMLDSDFCARYGEMLKLVARDYACYDRNDDMFPFFRTFDPWAGHSYAGGVGNGGGNGQESSSEAMQGWGGMYLLGVATDDKQMRDAAILGWTLEARGVAEYWYDRDRQNINYDIYPHPYNSNLTSYGVGWWTWFSGDPVWMHSIQWLPISNCLKYLYEDLDFARWDYTQMWEKKEIGGWDVTLSSSLANESGLGNVVMSYLQIFDPDSAAAVYDAMWNANAPVARRADTGGITYFLTHSHRSYGDIDWDVHADIPTATTYINKNTGVTTYMVYNADSRERMVNFYRNGAIERSVNVPPRAFRAFSDEPTASCVKIVSPETPVVEPGAALQLSAQVVDQYGASFDAGVVWHTDIGSIDTTGKYLADNAKGTATITASYGLLSDTLQLRIDNASQLTEMSIKGLPRYLEARSVVTMQALLQDQYGYDYPAIPQWEVSLDGTILGNDSLFAYTIPGVYTVKMSVGEKSVQTTCFVTPMMPNIALNCKVEASSTENVGMPAVNAVDGDLNTRWGSEHKDPQWIYVDLGGMAYIDHLTIRWEAAYASQYIIQVSDDAKTWHDKKTVSCSGGVVITHVGDTARYVRVYGVARGSAYGYSLYELEVYGVLTDADSEALLGIYITPEYAMIAEGDTISFDAVGYNYDGSKVAVEPQWTTDNGTFDDHKYTPVTYGMATVCASIGRVQASAQVYVEETVKLASIEITPAVISVIEGESVELYAEGVDQFGTPYNLSNVVFHVLEQGCSMSGNTFQATQCGEFHVVAKVDAVSDTATVVVTRFDETNVALYTHAIASSYENDALTAAKAVDGDMQSRWSSAFADNEYLQVDLGRAYVLDSMVVRWDAAYATDYRIESSLDGENWSIAYTCRNGQGGVEAVAIEPFAARYVRMVGEKRNTGYGISIYEWEWYGTSYYENPRPAVLKIEPSPVVAYVDEPLALQFLCIDQYNLPYTPQQICWELSGGGYVENNILYPTQEGEYILRLQGDDMHTSEQLIIRETPSVVRIKTEPHRAVAEPLQSVTFTALSCDSYGNNYPLSPVWNGCANGLFVGSEVAEYTVTAQYNDLTASSVVEVAPIPDTNIALQKSVQASSGSAAAAVDGSTNSRWESAHQEGPEWLVIDLGDVYLLRETSIAWETASAANYEVQVSHDGIDWVTAVAAADMNGARTDKHTLSHLARYVRLWCTHRATQWGYSVFEWEIYGRRLAESEPCRIIIDAPTMPYEVGRDVVATATIYNKQGLELDMPVLWWTTGGAFVTSDGTLTPYTQGNYELSAEAGFVRASLPFAVNSVSSVATAENTDCLVQRRCNRLYVDAPCDGVVALYTLQGHLLNRTTVYKGENYIPVASAPCVVVYTSYRENTSCIIW